MGFWDGIKRFFGVEDGPASDPVEGAVWEAIAERAAARRSFSAVNIAYALAARGAARDSADVAAWVEELFRSGALGALGYTRTLVRAGDRVVWIYHPVGEAPATAASPAPGTVGGAASAVAVPYAPAKAPPARPAEPSGPSPYDASDLVRLSPAELRARALQIEPWRTAWIGRVDVIPPADDERTALIDRGLVLRGLLTEEELAEIHRIGDLWLAQRDAALLARAKAQKSADAAIARIREEEAARKAKKKAEAAERAARRALEVARRKAEDIVFLGPGVSEQLSDRRANVEALEAKGLPVLATPADVARALGIPVPRLRWLAYHAEAATQTHYVQFEVDKRSGGKRLLSAPLPHMAAAQRWILDNVLAKLPVEPAAHGFVPSRSTVSNASAHRGRDLVVNLDLEDFFPTITFVRVRGFFASLGYSKAAATVLALLCTEAPRREVEYAGKRYHVAVGPRALPQGACTSPALSNQIARRLDRRLTGLCAKAGWTYTRYADDLTFSAPPGKRGELGRFLAKVRHIVEDEGFNVNEKKGRVQRAGGRQSVTGIVVNDKLGVPREELRRLRAILHNAKKTGLAAQNRAGHPNFEAYLRGKIAYVAMIDPKKGADLLARFEALPR